MSLGLPVHLAPFGTARAAARAMHIMALSSIAIALVCIVTLQALLPDRILWPAALAMVPMAIGVIIVDRFPSTLTTVAYLLIGAACVYWYVLVGTAEYPGADRTDSFIIAAAKVALILVGGVGSGVVSAAGWAIAGYLLAEGATILAASQTGSHIAFDGLSAATVAVIVASSVVIGVNRFRTRTAKPSVHRAARDEHLSHVRHRMEIKAAAMLHDTVLNHLAALSLAPDGSLPPSLRSQITADLQLLVGQEWLVDDDSTPDDAVLASWQSSNLAAVVNESVQRGLRVEVSGDRAALASVSAERSSALALAVKQCLVNVAKHSGVDSAEVVVHGSPGELSVMVVDAGSGFDVTKTEADRLGLRHSVFTRIEAVGGSVQLWSSPGNGTSVLIRVPSQSRDSIDASSATAGGTA